MPEIINTNQMNISEYQITLGELWMFKLKNQEDAAIPRKEFINLQAPFIELALTLGHIPFITKPSIRNENEFTYYDSLVINSPLLNSFQHEGNFYALNVPLPITRHNLGDDDKFQLAFCSKLDEYALESEEIEAFLEFTLCNEFKNCQPDFTVFLESQLIKYDSDPRFRIKSGLESYIAKLKRRKFKSYAQTLAPRLEFEKIYGKMNDAEIEYYFSFLYKEQLENKEFFMTRNDFLEMFRYGLSLPPENLPINRTRLNCSSKFNKTTVEFYIYKFYQAFETSTKTKKKILLFFATYIEDFSLALSSGTKLRNWSSNMSKAQRKDSLFDPDKYLPNHLKSAQE
jgi:hypothetical protein